MKVGRLALPRPFGLGLWRFATIFLVDGPDALLMKVITGFASVLAVTGRTA